LRAVLEKEDGGCQCHIFVNVADVNEVVVWLLLLVAEDADLLLLGDAWLDGLGLGFLENLLVVGLVSLF
jgi:hypothetical protein